MIRRHSVCLSDIPSFSEPFNSLYPHDTYHDPNNGVTIYTLRRASSPVMLHATTATDMTTMNTAEVNGPANPPKTAKKKNKKKKGKSRNKGKENGDSNGDDGMSQQNASMPFIVNGASLKHRTDGEVDKVPSETTTEYQSQNHPSRCEDDGLQRFVNSHRPPLYTNPHPSTQSSAAGFTPSVATTEDTIRASSVRSEKTVQNQQVPTVCLEHGRALCQFLPGCCVHRRKRCQECPRSRSCCCVHHAGDCCYCTSSRLPIYGEDSPAIPERIIPAPTACLQTETLHTPKPQINGTQNKVANEPKASNLDQFAVHALSLLENEEFCDCRIVLKSSNANFYPITFRAHKALIARSPRMKAILNSPRYREGSSNEIEAITGETFCMVKAFETALQNLYGLPILDYEGLRRAAVTALGYSDDNIHQVYPFPLHAALADFAMCYAASGAFFEVREIVEAGMRLAAEVLHWDNVEMVLYFALCVSRFIIVSQPSSSPSDNESTSSSNPQETTDVATHELRDIHAPNLTTSVLTFLINHIQTHHPQPFTLYISAQCKCMPDRIPEHLRQIPGSILSNPKLAEVKFGSFASLEETKPSAEVAILSAILICLPFKQLQEAFGIMNERGVLSGDLAQAIVVEREARRLYALRVLVQEARQEKKKKGKKDQKKGGSDVQELGYREFFTTKSVHSDKLQREWIGLV